MSATFPRPAVTGAQLTAATSKLWIPGRYYGPPTGQGASTNSPQPNGRAEGHAFMVPLPLTIDQIACNVVVAGDAASVVRLLIYADSGAGVPSAVLLDAGTVSGATTGAKTISVSYTIPAGLVWLFTHTTGVTVTGPALARAGGADAGAGWLNATVATALQYTSNSGLFGNVVYSPAPALQPSTPMARVVVRAA